MNADKYLKRINFLGNPRVDLSTLIELHKCHVTNVPFENLDIQNKKEIRLEKKHLFKKVVANRRGGFCYELNFLFRFLLIRLGFDVKLISAQIFNGEEQGPEFDHMALIVKLKGTNWLTDVGFGDLFMKPIHLENTDNQYDDKNYFKIEKCENGHFLLLMSNDGTDFEKKYIFQTDEKKIEQFIDQCQVKQLSNDSYFVENKVVTMHTLQGRKTIFNEKYSVKNKGIKTEFTIENEKDEMRILKKEFNITI